MLIKHLPAESATKTGLRNSAPEDELAAAAVDRPYGPWSQTDMLLADLIDVARWLQWSKTTDAEEKSPKNIPEPFPRPGVKRSQDRRPAPVSAEVVNLLDYMREHRGAPPPGWQQVGGPELQRTI